MLFADDLTSTLLGAGGMAALSAIGGGIAWLLTRRDRNQQSERDNDQKDEETALMRLRKVMELREEDCNRRIIELTHRIDELEKRVEVNAVVRDGLRERLAHLTARSRYLESLLKQAGVKPDVWTDLPSDNYPSPTQPLPSPDREPTK